MQLPQEPIRRAAHSSQRVEVLGTPVRVASLPELIGEAMDAIETRREQIIFACANVHSIVVARSDPEFRQALESATHVVPDGVGVLLVARLAHPGVGHRITGTQYFDALMAALDASGTGRVFFLGSSDAVLVKLEARLRKRFPHLIVCGTYSPPFGIWDTDEDDRMVTAVNATRPDVLWVSLTAPKQEKWIERNKNRLDASVVGAVGAVFDFYAGTKARAPDWMCRLGLEWIHRFLREPRRLWRRHFISIPTFIVLAFAASLRAILLRHRRQP